MLETLALAGLSAGMSALSGMGQQQAAAKQGRQQMINDAIARQQNNDMIANHNAVNARSAAELLKVPQITEEKTYGHIITSDRTTQDQSNYSYVDVDGMMAAAERAGFNPKTWLDAGALGAYTQTGSHMAMGGYTDKFSDMTITETKTGHNAAAAYQLMSPESALVTASQAAKIPSTWEIIGNAGTAGLNTFNQLNGKQQAQDFQRELLGMQLAARGNLMSNNSQYGGGMAGTPSYTTSGGTTTKSAAGSQDSGYPEGPYAGIAPGDESDRDKWSEAQIRRFDMVGLPYPDKWKVGEVERTNPYYSGRRIDPGMANADKYADRYGDIAEEIVGGYNFLNDNVYDYTGLSIPDNYRLGMNALSRSLGLSNNLPRPQESINRVYPGYRYGQ